MKKKLVLLFMMMFTMLGVVSCGNNDPYASMTISRVGGNDTPIQLTLDKVDNVFKSNEETFKIKVDAGKDVSDFGISIGSGKGFIGTRAEYIGDGITEVTAYALSPSYTGPFSLDITTAVRKKTFSIPLKIYVTLDSFEFVEDKLVAVKKGDSIDLTRLNEFISFTPDETTQRDLEFELVLPTDNEDLTAGKGFVYESVEGFVPYEPNLTNDEPVGAFAEIIDNRILQTKTTFFQDGESKNVTYPIAEVSVAGDNPIYEERIILKASYSRNPEISPSYVCIKVLDDCTNIRMKMNKSEKTNIENDNYFDVTNIGNPGLDKYEYDVVLTTPMLNDASKKYNYERTIGIDFGVADNQLGDDAEINISAIDKNDFEIVSIINGVEEKDNILSLSDKKCVTIFPSGDGNFVVTSTEAGEYSHTFILRHKHYPAVIFHEIVVNFKVIELPRSMYINGNEYSSAEYIVCDNYPNNWAEFKINLGDYDQQQSGLFKESDFYVALNSGVWFENDLVMNSRSYAGQTLTFAQKTQEGSLDDLITSFVDGATFYLKHTLEDVTLGESSTIYVVIPYELISPTYNSDIIGYFKPEYIEFPINLKFVKTIEKFFGAEQKTLFLDTSDLTNEVEICRISGEMDVSDVVKRITYDESLINVNYKTDDNSGETVFYATPKKQVRATVNVVFEAKNNGLVENIDIELYMASFYSTVKDYPLHVEITSSSSSYLYYLTSPSVTFESGQITALNSSEPHAKTNIEGSEISYESTSVIFMQTNSSLNIGIYDYLKGNKYSVLKDCRVSYNASYLMYAGVDSVGTITTRSQATPSGIPTNITITYDIFEVKDGFITVVPYTHTISIFILNNLRKLATGSQPNNLLYVDKFLGYYDRGKASKVDIDTNFDSLINIGTEWNNSALWGERGDNPTPFVGIKYSTNLENPIVDNEGNQIKISAESTSDEYPLYYKDLFVLSDFEDGWPITVQCKITGNEGTSYVANSGLANFLKYRFYSDISRSLAIKNVLDNYNIALQVELIAYQFNYERLFASRTFIASMPNSNTGFELSVKEDGVYGEVSSNNSIKVYYTLNNVDATNKELIILENGETDEYRTRIVQTNYGNAGYIEIIPKLVGGYYAPCNYNIKITTKDNVKNFTDGTYVFSSNNSLTVKTFRVKFADGSQPYPFEISNLDSFKNMVNKTNNGEYYHYVLTQDLDLISYSDFTPINLTNLETTKEFSLSGKHSFIYNGYYYERYSAIYNLRIYKDLAEIPNINVDWKNLSDDHKSRINKLFNCNWDNLEETERDALMVEYQEYLNAVNIGLFGAIDINNKVTISDLAIRDAKITVVDSSNKFNRKLNIGILAGFTDGSITAISSINGVVAFDTSNYVSISNCAVSGNISIDISKGEEVADDNTNVGGMIGIATQTTIAGRPSGYVESISSTGDNANVSISIDGENKSNIGGLVGNLNENSIIDTAQIVSLITLTGKSVGNVGGVVGYAVGTVGNVEASPRININTTAENQSINVGGLVASLVGGEVTNSKVYFVNIGTTYDSDEKMNLYVVANNSTTSVGGLVGLTSTGKISYTYARSFYNNLEFDDTYLGNIYVKSALGSTVGGIVGTIGTGGNNISYSYFDGDILVSNDKTTVGTAPNTSEELNVKAGLLAGEITGVLKMSNCYAVGLLYRGDNSDNLTIARGLVDYTNAFGALITGNYYQLPAGSSIEDAYAVINQNVAFITKNDEANKLYGYYEEGKAFSQTAIISLAGNVKNAFTIAGFELVDGETEGVADKWFYNTTYPINTVEFGAFVDALPILIDSDGNAMYDLVPTGIGVIIKEGSKYDISQDVVVDGVTINKTQLLMFLNENPCYEIKYNSDSSTISVLFNDRPISTSYVNIPLNTSIEFDIKPGESKDVLKIVGNKIYAKNKGKTTLLIRSVVDNSIATEITFVVVNGVTSINLTDGNNKGYDTKDENNTSNQIFVDELNTMYINPNSNAKEELKYIVKVIAGNIILNGLALDAGDKILVDESQIDIIGKGEIGSVVKLDIIPCVRVNDVTYIGSYDGVTYNNLYPVTDLRKTYTFKINGRAISMLNDIDSASVSVSSSTNGKLTIVTTNVSNVVVDDSDPNNVKVNGILNEEISFNFDGQICKFGSPVMVGDEFAYELLKFVVDKITFAVKDGVYIAEIYYLISFNETEYNEHAENYDLNNISYDVKVTINSNGTLRNDMSLTIAPSTLRNIFVDYYPRTSISIENNHYTIENNTNASKAIIFSQDGIMKITPDEKLNDSSYMVVLLPESVRGFVKIDQMTGVQTGDVLDTFKFQGGNYDYEYSDGNNKYFGIRLRKISQENYGNPYFNDAYFVKLTLYKKLTNIQDIEVLVHSFRVGEEIPHVSKQTILSVAMLPEIEASVDSTLDSERAVIGVGTKKLLKIIPNYTTNDIIYNIKNDLSANDGKIYIAKEVNGKLEDQGGIIDIEDFFDKDGNRRTDVKFYLCADVTSTFGSGFKIIFSVKEVVLGVLEDEETTLKLNIVEYEMTAIEFVGATENKVYSIAGNNQNNPYFSIKHGTGASLDLNIHYREIEIGEQTEIEDYKANLNAKFKDTKESLTSKELLELQLSSSNILVEGDSIDRDNLQGINKIYFQYYYYNSVKGEVLYPDLEHDKVTNCVRIQSSQKGDTTHTYVNQYLVGVIVGRNNKFRLSFAYSYGSDGKLRIANADSDRYLIEIDFTVDVTDNSTYDHPVPIENAQQFLEACNSEEGTGEFILLNNITLQAWKPIDAKFKSLDGNGYQIKIESFDLDDFRGATTANVGLFSTVSSNTLLKNLTINVASLLVSENKFRNDVNRLLNSTSEDTFIHDINTMIDLSYIPTVNFGVLAGTNYGTITNVKIINSSNSSENIYLHVLTNQQDKKGVEYVSNIGTLVGVNSKDTNSTISGAITNSFAGISKTDNLTVVSVAGNDVLNNEDDVPIPMTIYPFTIVGGNNLAGLVAINEATIASCYTKALGLYNTYTIHENNMSAGFVGENTEDGIITNSFVEGREFSNYRAIADNYMIESQGDVGGLVFKNAGIISNAYSNVYIENRTALSGAFVFENSGTIENSYTAGTTHTKESYGDFTGSVNHVLQNTGNYINCYYIVLDGESVNSAEDANALQEYKQAESDESVFKQEDNWQGFVFVSEDNHKGVWTLSGNRLLPELNFSAYETFSFRTLTSEEYDTDENNKVYNYSYYTSNELGSVDNPLVLDTSENFIKYILNESVVINKTIKLKEDYHIRIVNNLDFSGMFTTDIVRVDEYGNKYYLHNLDFNGILEGNGMTLQNMQIKVSDGVTSNNFGLFSTINGGVIKNLNITLNSYATPSARSAGVLAGEIKNSVIANVNINGNNNVSSGQNTIIIRGNNLSGGVAGIISKSRLYYVSVSNVALESGYTSIDESINILAGHDDLFKSFTIYNEDGSVVSSENKFTSRLTSSINNVSYSGGIAGIVESSSVIENINVRDSFYISQADTSGGIVGFLSKDSKLSNAKFEIADDSQLIKGVRYAGGLVGENYGTIERSSIEHSKELQDEIDATIVNNEREKGVTSLFSLLSTFNVAVGGIAGYSAGTIVDCYSKANVINSNSYIAGGLVGYGDIGNTIKLSYSTGIVYSNEVIGGIVGFQNGNTIDMVTSALKLDRVVALTDWNAQGDKDDEEIDYRKEITSRLYNNISGFYSNNGAYNKFFIKMPEIGNLKAKLNYDGINSATKYQYENDHDKYYVGSAIGKMYLSGKKFIDEADASKITNCMKTESGENNTTVFTNTLGLYSTSGSVSSGNRKDSFTNLSFSLDVGYTKQSIYSYRIAYNPGPVQTGVDGYGDKIYNEPISDINHHVNKSGYYDYFDYPKVFTAQEYTQQLLGSYAELKTIEGDKIIRFTSNIFDNEYMMLDRFVTRAGSDSNPNFVTNVLTNWTMGEYLPEFRSKRANLSLIENFEDFKNAIISNSADAVYKLKPSAENKIEINIGTNDIINTTRYIWNNKEINFSLIGYSEENRPKLIFNIPSSSSISTIFQGFDGAKWSNVDIEVNYSNIPVANYYTDAGSVALFANKLIQSSFANCSITINTPFNTVTPYNITGYDDGVSAGVVFGVAESSSTISGVDFKLKVANVNIASNNVSFGYIAGGYEGGSVNNITLAHVSDVNITAQAMNYAVGAFGYFKASSLTSMIYANIDGNNYQTLNQNVKDTYSGTNTITNEIKVGVITGNSLMSNFKDIDNYLILNFVDEDAEYYNKNIYVGMIAGHVGADGNKNGGKITGVTNHINTSLNVDINKVDIANIGGFVGNAGKASVSIYSSGSYAPIIVNATEAMEMNVGGLVGYALKLFTNVCYHFGNINVSNADDVINLGGVIGHTKEQLYISNLVVSGTLTISGLSDFENNSCYVGGVVGKKSKDISLSNFAILTDFGGLACNSKYVGGITCSGNSSDKIENGYVYSETHKLKNEGSVAVIKYNPNAIYQDVYYAQEFSSLAYEDHDSYFKTFAIADLYTDMNNYNSVLSLTDMKKVNYLWGAGKVQGAQLFVPQEICWILSDVFKPADDLLGANSEEYDVKTDNRYIKDYFLDTDGLFNANKYNLTHFTGGKIEQSESVYYAVLEDINNMARGSNISANTILSGRTRLEKDGYRHIVTIDSDDGGDVTNKYFFDINAGVISNLTFSTMVAGKAQYLGLCKTNTGLIVGVMLYGETKLKDGENISAFVTNNGDAENFGRIFKCVSSYISVAQINSSIDVNLYPFAKNVNKSKIIDVYSETFGYYIDPTYNITYKIDFNNLSRYFIGVPNEVSNINKIGSSDEKTKKSSNFNTHIWDNANSGMPFIKGFNYNYLTYNHKYHIQTKLTYNGSRVGDIDNSGKIDVKDLKEYVRNDSDKKYQFGYILSFYQDEPLTYESSGVIHIFNGDDLNEYLAKMDDSDSITHILLIEGENSINLTDSKCLNLEIGSNGAIIGIKALEPSSYGLVDIKFNSSYLKTLSSSDNYLIKKNDGLIVNFNFNMNNVTIYDKTFIADNTHGTIANVMFAHFTITSDKISVTASIEPYDKDDFNLLIMVGDLDSGYYYGNGGQMGEVIDCSLSNFTYCFKINRFGIKDIVVTPDINSPDETSDINKVEFLGYVMTVRVTTIWY